MVVTASPDSIAHRCLSHEGVPHTEVVHTDDEHYGRLIAERWEGGEPFVIVEHDLCPWIGAIAELLDCSEPWCGFDTVRWGSPARGLACCKITPQGPAPAVAAWQHVDGMVLDALNNVYGTQHIHSPPIAHAREW